MIWGKNKFESVANQPENETPSSAELIKQRMNELKKRRAEVLAHTDGSERALDNRDLIERLTVEIEGLEDRLMDAREDDVEEEKAA